MLANNKREIMQVTAQDVLNYVVGREKASEDNPLILGNVEFWHPIPGLPVNLCYSIHTSRWDVQAVQNAINERTASYWDEMVTHLQAKTQ